MEKAYDIPLPSTAQLTYHKEELAAFIHFGMNTFYEREWGDGTEDPERFHPARLDADQWIKTLKETGFQRVILVVKHHDGFVLYPSKHTDFTVAKSPWKNGQGDVLLEVSKAVTKYDMGLGIYLSPWDAHDARYSVDRQEEYNDYYLNQLKEILENPDYGNNGEIVEIWMDGARGEGAEKVAYDFDKWFAYIRSRLGEDVCIFSPEATSVRWVGNEAGIAGDPLWQRVKAEKMSYTEPEDLEYVNHGDPYGNLYSIAEADVSIRNGWFYKEGQQLKTPEELLDIYFQSVGRGTPLLLNVPPDKEGRLSEEDVRLLKEFRCRLDRIFANKLKPAAFFDTDGEWIAEFSQKEHLDLIEVKEAIQYGQRVAAFQVDYWNETGWEPYFTGTTIGAKRLIKGPRIQTTKIRIRVLESFGKAELDGFAFYDSGHETTIEESTKEDTEGQPVVEFTEREIIVDKGTLAVLKVKKEGRGEAHIKVTTSPHTAVHGKHYMDRTASLTLGEDEEHAEVIVETLRSEQTSDVKLVVRLEAEDRQTMIGETAEIEIVIR